MKRSVFLIIGFIGVLSGCGGGGGGGGNSTGGGGQSPDLSRYTITPLGIRGEFAVFNDNGDALFDVSPYQRPDGSLDARIGTYRYHNGALTKVAEYRHEYSLSSTDGRYVVNGVLYREDGTPIPTPTGKPGLYQSGNQGLVVFVERVVGEWAYGYTMANPGALTFAQPFRWRIDGGQIEPLGKPGDYGYRKISEQFISQVYGDRNGRAIVVTTTGVVRNKVLESEVKVYEADGTRYDLNELSAKPGESGYAYTRVNARIAEDGTICGSRHPGYPETTGIGDAAIAETAFSFSGGKIVPGPTGLVLDSYQFDRFYYLDDTKKTQQAVPLWKIAYTWSPSSGKKAVPTPPYPDALPFAQQNRRGQILTATSAQASDLVILTPK